MIGFAALQQEIMPKHGLNDEHHFHESCEHYVELNDKEPVEIMQNTFFRSNALHCTATARVLIPAQCSAIS